MKINIITIFPEFFQSALETSILGRAVRAGLVEFEFLQLRDFADGKNKKIVDDKPFGGGPGMVMKIEPIDRALEYLEGKGERGEVILTAAQGEIFTQRVAEGWAEDGILVKNEGRDLAQNGNNKGKILTIICGHYEGVDARVKNLIDREISIGQFVLTGGEVAALVMIDATVRLLKGVLGNEKSLEEESFCMEDKGENELEYPQYTQPREYKGWKVPEVLLSGNHREIEKWRRGG